MLEQFERAIKYLDDLTDAVPTKNETQFTIHSHIVWDISNTCLSRWDKQKREYVPLQLPPKLVLNDMHSAIVYYLKLAELSGIKDGWISKVILAHGILYRTRIERWITAQQIDGTLGMADIYNPKSRVFPYDINNALSTKISSIRTAINSAHPCGNIIQEGFLGYRFVPDRNCKILNDPLARFETRPIAELLLKK